MGRDPTPRDLATFTRQFSVMVDAGIPLVQCLAMLGAGQRKGRFKAAIRCLQQDVEGGEPLAAAMRAHPVVWDEFYTNMVAAGEAGGILDVILERLAFHLEGELRLGRVVRSAIVHPVVGILGGALGIVATLQFLVPALAQPCLATSVPLPPLTRLTLSASQFTTNHVALVSAGPVALVAGLSIFYVTRRGRYAMDGWLLRLPLVGPLLRRILVVRFARTMSTLVSSGVPILESLDVTARRAGNALFEACILRVRRGVEEGQTIVDNLAASKVFPDEVVQLIGVGEQTGALDHMLAKVGTFYEGEIDAEAGAASAPLKAVILASIAVMVVAIASSAYAAFAFISALTR